MPFSSLGAIAVGRWATISRPSGRNTERPEEASSRFIMTGWAHIQSQALGLARAGRDAVGLDSGGLGITVGAIGVASGGGLEENVGVGQGSLAHLAERLATACLLAILPVRGQVERDEQEEVRAEDSHARESSELLTGALARIGQPREVGRGEVGPRSEVDKACKECRLA